MDNMRTECFFHFTGFIVKGITKKVIDITYNTYYFLQIKWEKNLPRSLWNKFFRRSSESSKSFRKLKSIIKIRSSQSAKPAIFQ